MTLPKINPTTTQSWKKLQEHFQAEKTTAYKIFLKDPNRFDSFSIQWEDFLVDFSKNRLTKETLDLLEEPVNEVDLKAAMRAYFDGEA